MTPKMGIERKMREAIPEVSEVVQVFPQPEDEFRQEKKTSPSQQYSSPNLGSAGLNLLIQSILRQILFPRSCL